MIDLGTVARLHAAFTAALPRVTPFYAVKCMPEPGLLRMLAALGTGFDCASAAELAAVLALGVPAERVIYAHPVKPPAQARPPRARAPAGLRMRGRPQHAGRPTVLTGVIAASELPPGVRVRARLRGPRARGSPQQATKLPVCCGCAAPRCAGRPRTASA